MGGSADRGRVLPGPVPDQASAARSRASTTEFGLDAVGGTTAGRGPARAGSSCWCAADRHAPRQPRACLRLGPSGEEPPRSDAARGGSAGCDPGAAPIDVLETGHVGAALDGPALRRHVLRGVDRLRGSMVLVADEAGDRSRSSGAAGHVTWAAGSPAAPAAAARCSRTVPASRGPRPAGWTSRPSSGRHRCRA